MKTLLLTLFVSTTAYASSGGGAGGSYPSCLQTCMGCCRGETCEPGTTDQACGRNVCSVCAESDACQERACQPIRGGCSAAPGAAILVLSALLMRRQRAG